jgi:class 3 adenylate cyclase
LSTVGLAAVALAIGVDWVLRGGRLAVGDPGAALVSPTASLVAELDASGLRWMGTMLGWSIAGNIALAALLAIVLVAKVRHNGAAQHLASALAACAAAFAIQFLVDAMPRGLRIVVPDGAASRAATAAIGLALSCAAAALLYVGAGRMLRFWSLYPSAPDAEALRAYMLERIRHPPIGGLGGALRRWRQRRKPPDDAESSTLARSESLARDRVALVTGAATTKTRTGRVIAGWCIATAVVWWTSSLVNGRATAASTASHGWAFLLALGAVCCMATAVSYATERVADLVAFHHQSASGIDQRRIQWLYAAGVLGRISIESVPVVQLAAVVLMVVFPAASGQMFLGTNILALVLMLAVVPFGLILALGASVFARGLIDPRLALRRFTLWGLLGICLTFLFIVVERFLAMSIVHWLALPTETGTLVAGAAVAATFVPLRRAIGDWVTRTLERRMPARALARGERFVGAVAVVDISGFTRLSSRDEPAAILATALLQKEARRLADAHGGRLVKSTGDGALLAFHDACPAAAALRALHAAFAQGLRALSLPGLELHSGIHWGEYLETHDGDIYGNTVNIASRVADGAKPGEILVTDAFAQAGSAMTPPPTRVGRRRFRNVPAPIDCLRL